MRRILGFFALGVLALVATPTFAQVGPAYTSSSDDTISQAGSSATSGPLLSSRQTPNLTPSAPTQPVSNQGAAGAPQGIPGYAFAGGTLYPGATVGTYFDDNVFATNSGRRSDLAFFARPDFSWVTQGQNYTVAADGFIEGRKYVTFNSEDQVNGSFGTSFTLMPDNDTQIVGSVRYIHSHLDRGSSETSINGVLLSTEFARPVSYDEGLESLALNKRFGNWWTSLGAAGLEINYQNAAITGSSPMSSGIVNFNYADGGIGVANGRLGYVVAPLTSIFVEAAGNTRDWGVSAFDSTGFRVDGGVLFEQGPGARLKGEAWGGYMRQEYNGPTFQTVSSWTYGVSLAALLTDNLTAVVEGKREAKEAALGLAAISSNEVGATNALCVAVPGAVCVSAIESSIGGRLDYRILPNLVVGGGVTYLQDDYEGVMAAGRSDHTLGPLASLKYFPSDHVTLSFDYRNVSFESAGGDATGVNALPYYRNVYMLALDAKF